MSRHRNVRSMNYSEEYEGFDDVYGHSVEDDYCISPSEARFLYDRTRHPQMSAFINEESDIAEEDEHNSLCDTEQKELDKSRQTSIDEEKLRLCVDDILDVMGDVVPQRKVEEIVLKYNYDVQKSLDHILNGNETLGNVLLEDPLPQRESKTKSKDKDESVETSLRLESNTIRGLCSGGGDGPGNPVKKFVIPKLKNTQLEPVEKGIKDLNLSEGDVSNNFSSLQSLMEHHQKKIIKKDDIFDGKSSNSSPSTLAEFSKSFLNQKNSVVPPLPIDDLKRSFVIPKLQRKPIEQAENKWLIDLSSALKANPQCEAGNVHDTSLTNSSQILLQSSQDTFLESNFDASKILNADLELSNQKSSPFGKILCRKWKYNYINTDIFEEKRRIVSRIVRFDFSTPSPDDLILKYIRRK